MALIEPPEVQGYEVVDVAMPYAADFIANEGSVPVVTRPIPQTALVAIYARTDRAARARRSISNLGEEIPSREPEDENEDEDY